MVWILPTAVESTAKVHGRMKTGCRGSVRWSPAVAFVEKGCAGLLPIMEDSGELAISLWSYCT